MSADDRDPLARDQSRTAGKMSTRQGRRAGPQWAYGERLVGWCEMAPRPSRMEDSKVDL